MAEFYAIRHVHTGKFLPFTKKGYTTVEPMDASEEPPRLLQSYRGARQALAAWCRGIHKARWEYWSDDDPYSSAGGVYVDGFTIEKKPKRHKEDFEIVKVTMYFEAVK